MRKESVVSERATRIAYRDRFVSELHEDIGRLIDGDSIDAGDVECRLRELARTNSDTTATYSDSYEDGLGIPDTAYKTSPPYLFRDQEPARIFQTSNTTGTRMGRAPYSARGLELMDASILGTREPACHERSDGTGRDSAGFPRSGRDPPW